MPSVLHPDPFSAVLLNSPGLAVTQEQKNLIRDVLNKACSDSAFADKAYRAIEYILVAGSVNPVKVTSLSPDNALLGSPSFDIHVIGTGFDQFSKIVFAGQVEPTTLVSKTELKTGVNMDLWHGADIIPVLVESPVIASDPLPFTFIDPSAGGLSAKKPSVVEPAKVITPHAITTPVPEKSIFTPEVKEHK